MVCETSTSRASTSQARHRELHARDTEGLNRPFSLLEIANESDQIAIFSDVGAVGRRKRGQVAFNVHDVLYIQWKRLVEWRLEVTIRTTRSVLREKIMSKRGRMPLKRCR